MKSICGRKLILFIICLIGGLGLSIVAPVTAQVNANENMPSLTGTYDIKITTHPNCSYASKIGIEDLGDGKIKALGSFDGIPLSVVGHQTDIIENGSIYELKIYIPKLFKGTAQATFIYQNGNYTLSGSEKGTYNLNGKSGHSSATITGRRVSPTLPTSGISAALLVTSLKSPILWGAVLILLLLMIFLWIRSRKIQPTIKANPENESPDLPGKRFPWSNLLIGLGLFIAALTARLPWLGEVPRYVDELKEVMLAYSIYTGQVLPLHNAGHDIGAMHNYLLAGIFKLFGPNIYAPRLYVAVTGALTVVLLYLLGEKLYERRTGLLAAGILLTNGMHIMVTHKAWANCTTPFFFMLAMLATVNAEQRKSGKWLVLAGLLWAATLQTHPSVVIYLLAVGVYILSKRFRQSSGISTGWYTGAILAFLIGYSNMIYYNIASAGGSIKWLVYKRYALESHPGMHSFFSNLQQMAVELVRSVSSTYLLEKYPSHYLLHPFFLLSLILIGAGACLSIKKDRSLPVWMLLGGLAVMPWINQRYEFYQSTRYIMPLIICSILLMAYSIMGTIDWLRSRIRRPGLVTIPAITLLVVLMGCQLQAFYFYCNRINSTNLSNRPALQAMSVIQTNYQKGSVILVDEDLPIENKPLPDLLTISRLDHVVIPSVSSWPQAIDRYPGKPLIAVMNQSNYLDLKNHLPSGTRNYSVSSKVVFPNSVPYQRVIYVIYIPRSTT